MGTAPDALAIDMEEALEKASVAERAALDQVRGFYASDSWLEGQMGANALPEIDNVEFEIDRLLGEADLFTCILQ